MDALYQIVVYPLQLFIEIIYVTLYHAFEHAQGRSGLAILGVSLAVSFLTHPMYMKAEFLQDLQRQALKRMEKTLERIKRNFTGDKRYMLIDACYRKNGYHPLMALRSSLSLIIMIPFFMAAYAFLSQPGLLDGEAFLCFGDLSKEDALINMGSFRINVLPVFMTAVNILASFVYAEKLTKGEKTQLYLTAMVFLVFLYSSPSGLVIYWTFNNLFSLGKNIWLKYSWKMPGADACRRFLSSHATEYPSEGLALDMSFVLAAAGLWLYCGVVMPFAIASSSPLEFCSICGDSALVVMLYSAEQSFGLFMFWGILIYFMCDRKSRNFLLPLFCSMLAVAVICSFMNASESIGHGIKLLPVKACLPSFWGWLAAAAALSGLYLLFAFAFRKGFTKASVPVLTIFAAACAIFGFFSYDKLSKASSRYAEISKFSAEDHEGGAFSFSRHGKNVTIIFLDKAVSSFFPIICAQDPRIEKSFSGFRYYPNTASFYSHTILSVPSLFGGYGYSPEAMDDDRTRSMKEKHNNALLRLPLAFVSEGGRACVSDMPLKNYEWVSDNSMFEKHGIQGSNLSGAFTRRYLSDGFGLDPSPFYGSSLLKHDMLIYGFMRVVPAELNRRLYNSGKYLNASLLALKQKLPGENLSFIDAYSVLHYLPEISDVSDDDRVHLNILCNDASHEPVFLQYPDYEPSETVTDKGPDIFGNEEIFRHYHVNAAALRKIASWLEWMKGQGIYDNSRIIIVSDHGAPFSTPAVKEQMAVEHNPLLLIKDFGAKGKLVSDDAFMTCADVPLEAMSGVVMDMSDRMTGKPCNRPDKDKGIDILIGNRHNPEEFPESGCLFKGDFLVNVRDMFDASKWAPAERQP